MNRTTAADDVRDEYPVVIVGGGIAGSALLYELSRRGVEALLVERAERPAGASAVTAAIINPYRGRTARARQLDLAGMQAYWRLAGQLREAGHDPGGDDGGVLRIASNARQASSWQRLVGEAPSEESLEWLEAPRFPAPYHAPFGGIRVMRGGRVEPAKLLAALVEAALEAGGSAVFGSEFREWRRGNDGVLSISIGAGDETEVAANPRPANVVRARELVLCLGAYDPQACRLPRLEPATGLAITLASKNASPVGDQLPPLAGAIGLIPHGDRVHITGGALRTTAPRAADLAEAAENLHSAGSWYLPGITSATIEAVWHGTRVRRRTGTPVVRRLAPGVTLFGALAGRGFLAGPHLAERLASGLVERLATTSKLSTF